MRDVYICLVCATHCLPPEAMHYGSPDQPASKVHCPTPSCTARARDIIRATGLSEDQLAALARRAAGLEGEPRTRRTVRPARGRRATSAPRTARTRLL
ncbi:hypothetical protein ACWGJ2_17010 [Streptomyces sp. NPDC054796]